MRTAASTRPARRVVLAAGLAGLTALAATGCSDAETAATPSASGTAKMTIGVHYDQPGLGLKEGTSYSGFDIQVAKYVAAQLGVPSENITWKPITSSQRETVLEDGEADMVVATYSITDERKKVVDFVGPYFNAKQDLLIRRNDVEITGPDTLDGKNLCTATGTTSAEYIKKTYPGKLQLQEYGTYQECVDALAKGDVDAVTTDDVILAGFASQEKYKGVLKVVGKGFSSESYGIGLKKGSDQVTKVNDALKKYIDSGAWAQDLAATVGPSGYSIPAAPTPGKA